MKRRGPRLTGGLRSVFAVAAVVAVITASCAASEDANPAPNESADSGSGAATIVDNARVYTLNPDQPWAESFAYDADGVVIAVGTSEDVRAAAGDDAQVIDASGNMVLPGFQDPHVHVPEAGINAALCLLEPDGDLESYGAALAECAERQTGDSWVRAAGASLFDLRDTDESPLEVLDRAVPDRPAIVLDDLGHAVWTNSAGLAAAGIGEDDPDPQGGVLHRDENGALTGLLLEDAQQLVRNAAALSDEQNYQGLLDSLDELVRNGITTVSDAGGFWAQGHAAAWQRAADEGTLTVRAMNSLYVYPDLPLEEQVDEFAERFSDDPQSLLRFNTAKIYIDGILDLGTATMLEPYLEPPDPAYPSGLNYFEPDQLQTYVDRLHEMGYRINFHAIGNAAIRTALDAVEAIPTDGSGDRRHRITHAYLIDGDDVDQFEALGVVADFQQPPDSIDTGYHELLRTLIGDQAYDLIPTGTLLAAGAAVSLSSDWDADPLSPFGTIQRALTREANAVGDLETAIALVTIDAAYALGHDGTTGSIEVGKQADYIVIDQHLFDIEVDDIDQTRVLLTVVGGKEAYREPSW